MTKATGSSTSSARKADKAGKPAKVERARGGEARRIADLVPAIGDTAFRKFGFVQSALITRWPEIVGEKLARATRPESLKFPPGRKADGLLSISVAGAHGPVVQHIVPDIIARVNGFFGYAAVARVKLTQGTAARPAPPPRARIQAAPAQPSVPLGPDLSAISDPELRAVLEGLATSLGTRNALPKIS